MPSSYTASQTRARSAPLLIPLLVILLAASSDGECIGIAAAGQKIGETACVTGTVIKVAETRAGNFFLDFCEDYRSCPFVVFVPARCLRDVGDVRMLAGKSIEIHGKIQRYGGRAEIILKQFRQLKGEAAKIPPMPKQYDASRHGSFSATAPRHSTGSSRPTTSRTARKPHETIDPSREQLEERD